MVCATADHWHLRFSAETGVKQGFIRSGESGVVPVRQRATTGYYATVGRVADSLELPQSANQLQVADVLAIGRKNAANLIVDFMQR